MQTGYNIIVELQKMQITGGIIMQVVFSKKCQDKLLIHMAVNKLNRKMLSNAIGISAPTTRKLLTNETPLVVSDKTYRLVQNWLSNISLKEQ